MGGGIVSSTTFALATAVTGYLSYLCFRPPTPPKRDEATARVVDSISFDHAFLGLALYRNGILTLSLLQALLILLSPAHISNIGWQQSVVLSPILLTWNWISAITFVVMNVCALIRLSAMGELGRNFTFELREPNKLKTSGLYAHVQHPSYSSGIVVFLGSAQWFTRIDGVAGVIIPFLGNFGEWFITAQHFWNYAPSVAIAAAISIGVRKRILEEEAMLKKAFGKEWVDWHARTARLIPGVF